MMILAMAMVIGTSIGYANPESAKRVLADEGYTEVVIHGRKFFGCDKDFYRTEFSAKNARGIPVSGVVCEGLISGESVIKRS